MALICAELKREMTKEEEAAWDYYLKWLDRPKKKCSCGKDWPPEYKFCPVCGSKLP